MAIEWYVKRGTEQSGPISELEFEMLREHLRQTDLLKRSDWRDWRPYQSGMVAGDATAVDGELDPCPTPQAFLKTLLGRDLRGRGIAPERRAQYQYVRIVEELMQSVIEEIGSHPHWDEVLRDRYRQIVSMVEEFIDACNVGFWQREPRPDARDRLTVLWRHRDLRREIKDGTGKRQLLQLDREELLDIAYDYLRRDARSREFERLLVNALVAAEIYGFDDEIKKHASHTEPRGWFAPRLPWSASAKPRTLLAKMIEVYETLPDLEVNPANCRKLFDRVAKEGAGWDPVIFELLNAAGTATPGDLVLISV